MMNPGYLSLLLICMILILLSSGWKEVFLSRASHKEILLFFVLWITARQFNISFDQIKLNGSLIVMSMMCLYNLVKISAWKKRMQTILIGLLLAILNFVLLEFYAIDPIFVISRMGLDIAVWLSLVCICMTRNRTVQLVSLTIGFILGDIMHAYYHLNSASFVLGNSLFQDKWWLAIVIVGVGTVILQQMAISYRRFIHKFETMRKRGWK